MRRPLLFALLLHAFCQTAHAAADSIPVLVTVLASAKNAATGKPLLTIRVTNTSPTDQKDISLGWTLVVNGLVNRKGTTFLGLISARRPTLLQLPVRMPPDSAGESVLQLRYFTRRRPAVLVAGQQLVLRPWRPNLGIPATGELTLSDSNDIFTIHSRDVRISFHRQTGWLVRYEVRGIDLIEDSPGVRTNFWWAGYNDSATQYHVNAVAPPADSMATAFAIDSGWLAATREPRLQLFSNSSSPNQIVIRTEYTLPATSCLLHLSYTINAAGEMLITQQVEPDSSAPPIRGWPLPCFGMQWTFPPGYDSITEYRQLGAGVLGIAHYSPQSPGTDNDPRGAATRTGVRWWSITNHAGSGLQFLADSGLLDLSAVPLPVGNGEIGMNIDRPAPAAPGRDPRWPHPIPYGEYRYAYRVKPLLPHH